MNKYFILLILALVFLSCNNRNGSKTIGSIWASDYENSIKSFPDSLVSHFPSSFDESVLIFNTSMDNVPQSIKYLIITKTMDEKKTKSLEQLDFICDTCLFSIYLRKIEYGFNYYAYPNCETLLPVPETSLMFGTTSSNDNIMYRVIETSKEVLYNHESYLRSYLPDDWVNGMSRGISYNKANNLVCYWVIIW